MDKTLRAFLAMPFRPELRWVRNGIASAARRLDIQLIAADEAVSPGGDIVSTIRREIQSSSFAYVVLTDLNPNVMYELGLLHQASKPTILLSDRDTMKRLPFDVRGLMVIVFEASAPEEETLATLVAGATGHVLRLFDENTRSSIALGMQLDAKPVMSFPDMVQRSEAPPATQLFVAQYDFENIKESAAKSVGRKGCRTSNVSSHSDGEFKGWRLRAKCHGGERITVLIDLNGEVVEVDVE